jgi:hypothetical protein
MILSSSEEGWITVSCKPGNYTSGSIKSEEVLDQLSDCQLPKKDIYSLSQLRRLRNLRIIKINTSKSASIYLGRGQIAAIIITIIIVIIIFLIISYSFVKYLCSICANVDLNVYLATGPFFQ